MKDTAQAWWSPTDPLRVIFPISLLPNVVKHTNSPLRPSKKKRTCAGVTNLASNPLPSWSPEQFLHGVTAANNLGFCEGDMILSRLV